MREAESNLSSMKNHIPGHLQLLPSQFSNFTRRESFKGGFISLVNEVHCSSRFELDMFEKIISRIEIEDFGNMPKQSNNQVRIVLTQDS